jgi:hypothetical protein
LPNKRPVTPEEFAEWKLHETTQQFFRAIRNHREVMKEDLIKGLYDNPEFARGKGQAFLDIIEMKYEDFAEIMHDK